MLLLALHRTHYIQTVIDKAFQGLKKEDPPTSGKLLLGPNKTLKQNPPQHLT